MSKSIKIQIIDLRINNIFSLFNSLKKIGYKNIEIINTSNKINCNLLFLPGVGSFYKASRLLKKNNFMLKIKNFVKNKNNKLFGICLGMQLLFEESTEFGDSTGLGLVRGKVIKFDRKLRVPHVGWAQVIKNKKNLKSFNLKKNGHFYFVHSYYCEPIDKNIIYTKTNYHNKIFCSSIKNENIFGTQFHPEKSGMNGLKVLESLKKLF
tara:strand:+ start:416 stop:1039 length:624 start_codon:yes stop_codon:yes gene_type:complete